MSSHDYGIEGWDATGLQTLFSDGFTTRLYYNQPHDIPPSTTTNIPISGFVPSDSFAWFVVGLTSGTLQVTPYNGGLSIESYSASTQRAFVTVFTL